MTAKLGRPLSSGSVVRSNGGVCPPPAAARSAVGVWGAVVRDLTIGLEGVSIESLLRAVSCFNVLFLSCQTCQIEKQPKESIIYLEKKQ